MQRYEGTYFALLQVHRLRRKVGNKLRSRSSAFRRSRFFFFLLGVLLLLLLLVVGVIALAWKRRERDLHLEGREQARESEREGVELIVVSGSPVLFFTLSPPPPLSLFRNVTSLLVASLILFFFSRTAVRFSSRCSSFDFAAPLMCAVAVGRARAKNFQFTDVITRLQAA